MESGSEMTQQLVERLDNSFRLIDGTLLLSIEAKAQLTAQVLMYSAFLTDLAEGRVSTDTPEVASMRETVGKFCDLVESELAI